MKKDIKKQQTRLGEKQFNKSADEWLKVTILTAVLMLPASAAWAGLPWEAPLCTVAQSLSGPVANTIGVIVVVLTGLMLAFGEVSGVFKTLLCILFGLSIAFMANSWLGLLSRTSGCFATT